MEGKTTSTDWCHESFSGFHILPNIRSAAVVAVVAAAGGGALVVVVVVVVVVVRQSILSSRGNHGT